MIINKPLPWGEIRGKVSLTPEQAQKWLGFKMKKGAKGVFFRKFHGKLQVCNLMPRTPLLTNKLKISQERIRVLDRIIKENFRSLIYPIWNKLASGNLFGESLFISVNAKRVGIPPNWKKLLISKGPLPPPHFEANYCHNIKKIIIEKNFKKSLPSGIGIFDPIEKRLIHFTPAPSKRKRVFIDSPINAPLYRKPPIVFMYIKKDNNYSNSSAKTLKLCQNRKPYCNLKRRYHGKVCRLTLGRNPR